MSTWLASLLATVLVGLVMAVVGYAINVRRAKQEDDLPCARHLPAKPIDPEHPPVWIVDSRGVARPGRLVERFPRDS